MFPHTVLVTACLFLGFPGFFEVEVPSSAVERLRQEGMKQLPKFEDLNRRMQEMFDWKIQEWKIILPPGPARKRNHA
jgi:hypothetical protein